METVTFSYLQEHCKEWSDALVFLGCGGDIHEWHAGILDTFKDTDPAAPLLVNGEYHGTPVSVTTSGGRTDLIFPLGEDFNIGRLAMWRLQFGDCTWLSDYLVNYRCNFDLPQEKPKMSDCKYPKIKVELSGQDGNGFTIVGRVQKAMRDAKVSHEEIVKFREEAFSGNYDHLLQTCMKWVTVT